MAFGSFENVQPPTVAMSMRYVAAAIRKIGSSSAVLTFGRLFRWSSSWAFVTKSLTTKF